MYQKMCEMLITALIVSNPEIAQMVSLHITSVNLWHISTVGYNTATQMNKLQFCHNMWQLSTNSEEKESNACTMMFH